MTARSSPPNKPLTDRIRPEHPPYGLADYERHGGFQGLRAALKMGPQDVTGLIKTATISFGQAMPEAEMERASEEASLCDLMLVLGSSLVVYPAAGIPLLAKRLGSQLAIINREPTDQDPYADIVLNAEIGPLMRDVVGRL